jgi:hypothetical protein
MNREAVREQKSIWFFPEESLQQKSGDIYSRLDSVYLDVLPRDIPLSIMPIGGKSVARKNFAVSIVPADEQMTQTIAGALAENRRPYMPTDIKRSVCDFVPRIASRLLQREKVVFEIVSLRDPKTNELVGCDLFEINVQTLTFEKNQVFQRVPSQIAAERNVPTIIDLDIERLAVFSLPPEFRDLAKIKQALGRLGGGSLTQMYEASRQDTNLGYDIKDHIRSEHLAIAAATRTTGWSANQTQTLYELFTEYYVLHRQLVFQRFIIGLREWILINVNEVVGRIANLWGKTASIEVSGLPILADVQRAQFELAQGARTFASVLDDFSLL